jgi:hypothetical protein
MLIGYSRQVAFRREKSGMPADKQNCEAGRQPLLDNNYVTHNKGVTVGSGVSAKSVPVDILHNNRKVGRLVF